jgi:hypothetical protein
MRKFLLIAAVAAVLAVPVGVSAAAPPAKPTTTTAPTTTTTAPPTGITGHEIVYSPTTVPAHEIGQAQADCPSGKVVTGGGYALGSPPFSDNMLVRDTRPYLGGTTHSWLVVATNNNDVAYSFAAYAICADG